MDGSVVQKEIVELLRMLRREHDPRERIAIEDELAVLEDMREDRREQPMLAS